MVNLLSRKHVNLHLFNLFCSLQVSHCMHLRVNKLLYYYYTPLYYYFLFARVSSTDDSDEPSKTNMTPTTSIQFLCPGDMDDNTVY